MSVQGRCHRANVQSMRSWLSTEPFAYCTMHKWVLVQRALSLSLSTSIHLDVVRNWIINFYLWLVNYVEIPRVITALQQQNTAPEENDYEDGYQEGTNERGKYYTKPFFCLFCLWGANEIFNQIKFDSIIDCGKCKSGSKRLNLNKFCKRDFGKHSIFRRSFSTTNSIWP